VPASTAEYTINLIENDAGELLLLRRSAVNRIGAGLWCFPAGRIEPGETPEAGSRRELREEIGEAVALELRRRGGPLRDRFYGTGYLFHLFHYRFLGGEVRLNEESTEWAWVGREEYRSYPVMNGIDEDIDHFGIWPREFLNADRLP
jgi:8-oxo-dGTP diphosphatase